MSDTTRRNVLAGAAGVGAAVALAACGSEPESGSAPQNAGQKQNDTQQPTSPPANGQQGGGSVLAQTSEIPVNGGKIIESQGIVITQPAAGQFKAFSAKCTHVGCLVKTVANGTINCPCHNSKFSTKDGAVKAGPAPGPLPEKKIKVEGTNITLA